LSRDLSDPGQAPQSDGDLLFVYGSLRRGSSHHHLLQRLHACFAGPGSVKGQLFDLGRFPGARPRAVDQGPATAALAPEPAKPGRVAGELYRLRNPVRDLAALDRYEDYRPGSPDASFFRREVARIRRRDGTEVTAWIYWLNRASHPQRAVASGDYARRKIRDRP